MKDLTNEELKQNWDKLISIINNTFEGEKRDNLLKMYDYFQDRMMLAPASGKEQYHNAFPGGYVEHILHVIECSQKIGQVWKDMGAHIDWTDEELIFSAMHHDLGKVGSLDGDYYVPNDSEWHRKNQGKIYNHNGAIHYMNVTDRSFYLLNHFQVPMTEQEFFETHTPGYNSIEEIVEVIPCELTTIDMVKEDLKEKYPDVDWSF